MNKDKIEISKTLLPVHMSKNLKLTIFMENLIYPGVLDLQTKVKKGTSSPQDSQAHYKPHQHYANDIET